MPRSKKPCRTCGSNEHRTGSIVHSAESEGVVSRIYRAINDPERAQKAIEEVLRRAR